MSDDEQSMKSSQDKGKKAQRTTDIHEPNPGQGYPLKTINPDMFKYFSQEFKDLHFDKEFRDILSDKDLRSEKKFKYFPSKYKKFFISEEEFHDATEMFYDIIDEHSPMSIETLFTLVIDCIQSENSTRAILAVALLEGTIQWRNGVVKVQK